MTPADRIADIRKHLLAVERHTKLLHKSLADGFAEHGAALGLEPDQITALSGGTKE